MSDPAWRVLVPVEVLEGETVPDAVIELLSTLPVVVLGYHVVPEQTAPGQARLQFEDRAQAILDDLAAAFSDTGGGCETRLVFTHDAEQTLERVADETGCSAILVPNPVQDVDRVLVPLRGEVDVERIAAFVAAMIGDRGLGITLFHVAETADAAAADQAVLDEAESLLLERGIDADTVTQETTTSETPIQAIATAAANHDTVVMGESAPSLRTFLFGETSEQVAARSLGPVIVVRRERDTVADPV